VKVFYYIILYNFEAVSLIINPVQFQLSLIEFLANDKQFTISVLKQEIRAVMRFFCLKGDYAAITSRNINDVYGMRTASEQTVQNWVSEFPWWRHIIQR